MKLFIVCCFFITALWAEHTHVNALIKEDSPYLQQHANNPVHWYPWGEEALAKAKKENKPIFLSIGYSTCHWCHVMEEESFESEEIAKLLNDDYISIKVDREELPQLDKKYQQLYMSVYGERGGWPLSIFMTPRLEVFHLATYIPAEEGYGSDGMAKILPTFARQYHTQPQKMQKLIDKYKALEEKGGVTQSLKQKLTLKVIDRAIEEINAQFDRENGGFASKPKFPEASKIELLLTIYRLNANQKVLFMAEETLKKMAEGGIYDQIEGGFFRYTTDEQWQIPHFEKMLYTNAELIPVYVTLYTLTHNPLYKRVVEETIAHMEKYFMKEGLYLSASDADSDGEEGGYFIYSYTDVKKELLKKGLESKEVEEALAYLGIEEDGNIDGEFSHAHITQSRVPAKLTEVKNYLRGLRSKRAFPFVDTKIITAWNAMMIKALFAASKLDEVYLELGKKRLESLLALMRKSGILYHQTVAGKRPKQPGLLEDYAFLIDAMIEAYLRTHNKAYLAELQALTKEAIEKFHKEKRWYLSDDTIKAEADFDDRYYTSALSMMLEDLVRVSSLTEVLHYNEIVKETIQNHGALLEESPAKAAKFLHAFLRLKMGDVIVKSSDENLNRASKEIEAIRYPFLLSKTEESKMYLACRVNSCFAYAKSIQSLIENIEREVRFTDVKRKP